MKSICGRCHRVQAVGAGRYCPACTAALRASERRRSQPPEAEGAPALDYDGKTEPAPPEFGEERVIYKGETHGPTEEALAAALREGMAAIGTSMKQDPKSDP